MADKFICKKFNRLNFWYRTIPIWTQIITDYQDFFKLRKIILSMYTCPFVPRMAGGSVKICVLFNLLDEFVSEKIYKNIG